MLSFIVFILVLGFLISIHEFGHLIVAKSFGVYCGQYSIGMGPKIYSHQFGETNFELRLLPIGGFVSMAGEDAEEDNELFKNVPKERTLKALAWWKKICVFLAGVMMNFISAYIIIVLVYFFSVSVTTNSNQIGSVVEDSPAYEAGLVSNDIIQQIINEEGEVFTIETFNDLAKPLTLGESEEHLDAKTFKVIVSRDQKEVELNINAIYNENANSYFFGVSPVTRSLSFKESCQVGFSYCKEVSTLIVDTLRKLFSETKETVSQLSGPVGIYEVTNEMTSSGNIASIFELVAMLGINLGIFNLMPIPGLDGYQILVTLVETVIGRELPTNFKVILQLLGLALVFGLMIIVTFNDLFHLF